MFLNQLGYPIHAILDRSFLSVAKRIASNNAKLHGYMVELEQR